MKRSTYLAVASVLAPSTVMAANSAPTITIACFGSDLALSSKSDVNGMAQLAAEVLSLGDGRATPNGTVVFFVDNEPIGPAGGVPLRPGHDPRTGQVAGLASLSLPVAGGMHLGPGSHTVTARFVPAAGSGLDPSASSAANNLRIGGAAVAALPVPAASTPPAPMPVPAYSQPTNFTPPPAPSAPMQTASLAAPPLPPSDRFWVSVEENILQLSGDAAPGRLVNNFDTIVNTGVSGPTPVPTSPGFIGLKTFSQTPMLTPTGTAFGGPTDTGIHNGQTLSAGYWLDPGRQAIDGEFFYADPDSHTDFQSPTGGNMAIQVRNPNSGLYSNYIISQTPTTATTSTFINTTPAVFVHLQDEAITSSASGNMSITSSINFLSSDLKYRMRLVDTGAALLDLTAGLRYADLSESMNIGTAVNSSLSDTVSNDPALGLPFPPSFTNTTTGFVTTSDTFHTGNHFIGPQIGLSGKYDWGQLWISGDAKIALGPMFESLRISGSTNSIVTTSAASTTAIMLAGIPLTVGTGGPPVVTTTSSSSRIGLFGRSGHWGDLVLAALPSADFKVGYDLIPDVLSVTAGYSAMFLSQVARPGNQINNTNPGNLAQTGFWAQGVTVGVKYRFD